MHRFFVILLILCSTVAVKAEERIMIGAEINGKPVRLIFDTGAEKTCIFDHAGIRNEDTLLSVDNLDVTKWRTNPQILPLSRFWEQSAGTKLKLSLERNGEQFDTMVILKDIFSQNNLTKNTGTEHADGQPKNSDDKK